MEDSLSNAASVVGRYLCILGEIKDHQPRSGRIVAYDPETNKHTVKFDADGSERAITLNKIRFQWLVQEAEPDRKERKMTAVKRGAVGRKLTVYSKTRQKWFQGTVMEYIEEKDKHKIRFQKGSKIKLLNLKKHKWRYTDMKGPQSPSAMQRMSSSRYAGVQRVSENSWKAFKIAKSKGYIGTFSSEKEAALAYDVFARKEGRPVNFTDERISEEDIGRQKHPSSLGGPRGGKCKYRGVHWQKNRNRWMARYSLAYKGKKNINLGAFLEVRHAALAFDSEARKRGRPDSHLNFPNEHPTEAQIDSWKMNNTHYSMMRSGRKKTSQFRGVCYQNSKFQVQINITKVVVAYGKKKGPIRLGKFTCEKEAALLYDRVCRIPEKDLNFPRNTPLKEVRLFDDECYMCHDKVPDDPVATPCNHVFCRPCIQGYLTEIAACPCCQTPYLSESNLRSVTLVSPSQEEGATNMPGNGDTTVENSDSDGDDGPNSGLTTKCDTAIKAQDGCSSGDGTVVCNAMASPHRVKSENASDSEVEPSATEKRNRDTRTSDMGPSIHKKKKSRGKENTKEISD